MLVVVAAAGVVAAAAGIRSAEDTAEAVMFADMTVSPWAAGSAL